MVPKVLKPASSARRAHSTSVLPSVSGIVVGRPIPTSTMTPLLDPRVELARPVNHRTKLGYRYGRCHNSSDPSLSSGGLGGYSEDGPRDNHGHHRSTAVSPNSLHDQRRRRDQHGLTTRSLDGMQEVRRQLDRRAIALHGSQAAAPTPGMIRHRQPGSVGGRGNRRGAGRTPRAGAAAQAASGSRSWCRRRGYTARPRRPARGRWRGRRQATPRTAPAALRSAGPSPGPAKSPPNQVIEYVFENESARLLSLDPPARLGACSGVIMKRVP